MITTAPVSKRRLNKEDPVIDGTVVELLPWNQFPQRQVVGIVKPDRCRRVLADTNFYLGQRNLNKNRVEDLGNRIRTNLFHVARLCFAMTPESPVLMDGQHSLTAAGQTARRINFAASEIWCPTVMDLATLFAQHDNGGKRTAMHIAHAYAASNGMDLSSTTANNLAKGLALVTWGYDGPKKRISAEDKAVNMVANKKLALTVGGVIDPLDPPDGVPAYLLKTQTVAAIFLCARLSDPYSKKFWGQVRDGEDIKSTDPAYKLRNWLDRVVVSNSSTTLPGKRRVTSEHLLAQCLEGWNAFRESRVIKMYAKCPAELPTPV